MASRALQASQLMVVIAGLCAGMPAGAEGEKTWAIPGDQGTAVFALLPPEGGALPPTEYRVTDVEIRRDLVEVRLSGAAGDRQTVTLLHPSRSAAGAARTRYFAVEARDTRATLARAVAAYVAARETAASPWREFAAAMRPSAPPRHPRRTVLIVAAVVLATLLLVFVWRCRSGARPAQQPPASPPA